MVSLLLSSDNIMSPYMDCVTHKYICASVILILTIFQGPVQTTQSETSHKFLHFTYAERHYQYSMVLIGTSRSAGEYSIYRICYVS